MPNEWISVKEKLPKKNGKYLCCCGNKYIRLLGFARSLYSVDRYTFANEHRSGFYDYDSEYGYYEWSGVTHWMPLPELPKAGADNG